MTLPAKGHWALCAQSRAIVHGLVVLAPRLARIRTPTSAGRRCRFVRLVLRAGGREPAVASRQVEVLSRCPFDELDPQSRRVVPLKVSVRASRGPPDQSKCPM